MRHLSFLFFSAVLAGTALANPDSTPHHEVSKNLKKDKHDKTGTHKATAEELECHDIFELQHIIKLGNENKANERPSAHVRMAPADATAKLRTLQSNATLAQQCSVVGAHKQLVKDCHDLTYLGKVVGNQTAIAEMAKHKNSSDTAAIAAKVTQRYNSLKGNSSLSPACANLKTPAGKSGPTKQTTSGGASVRHIESLGTYVFGMVLAGLIASLML